MGVEAKILGKTHQMDGENNASKATFKHMDDLGFCFPLFLVKTT